MSSIKANTSLQNLNLGSLEQTEFYRLLVNSIQDYAIFLMDPSGYIASWNLGAQKLKGYDANEIIGKHFSVFYTPQDIAKNKPQKKLEACNLYGHIEDEGWRVKKDGSRFWANVVITALRNPDGELVGYAKVTRDLTERKRHEDELNQANEILKQQQVELEELNQSKDEFISLASHQLRTPATGVKQFLGLVLEGYAGDISDMQRDFINRAYDSNNRQINLVNDLLRVAQIDAGKIVLNKTKVDVGELIKDVVSEQVDSFKVRCQHLSLNIPKTALVAHVDKMRFRMVIENLLENAGKYTPSKGEISISLRKQSGNAVISIQDNGVGMAPDALPKLFTKFTRIQNELSDNAGGSGLGLYWAYKIVKLHGGDITVSSKLNKGSTFTIIIPQV